VKFLITAVSIRDDRSPVRIMPFITTQDGVEIFYQAWGPRDGQPVVFAHDGLREGSLADRSSLYHTLADGPFFGRNRDGADIPAGPRDAFWLQGMAGGHKSTSRRSSSTATTTRSSPTRSAARRRRR
jgi:hypothetical protein